MARWFKDEIEELRNLHADAVAQGLVGQPLADHIGPKIGRSPQSVKWALKTYLNIGLGRAKRISTKPEKSKRLTRRQRENLVEMARGLLDDGIDRNEILDRIGKRFNLSRAGVATSLSRNGVTFPEEHYHTKKVRKKEKEAQEHIDLVSSISANIDTGKHPYYVAARILDEKPGKTAEVRDGVCFLNGFPCPAVRFLAEAGMEFPQ